VGPIKIWGRPCVQKASYCSRKKKKASYCAEAPLDLDVVHGDLEFPKSFFLVLSPQDAEGGEYSVLLALYGFISPVRAEQHSNILAKKKHSNILT
jgi:hypothetical protein